MVEQRPAVDDWPDNWFVSQTSCLWCGGAALMPLLSGVRDWFFAAVPGEFTIQRCVDCSSLLLDRRPDDPHIGEAYAGYYTHEVQDRTAAAGIARRAARLAKRAYVARRYGSQATWRERALSFVFGLFGRRRLEVDVHYRFLPARSSKVLDFGCGNGEFLRRAAELGHQVTGIDFDRDAVTAAVRRGLPAMLPAEVENENFDGRFDLITANHVIEHVADPQALLRQFRRWLRPGGRLFIEVPDAQAQGIARHGRFWRGLEAPRHFSLPSRAALLHALERAGFAEPQVHHRAFLPRQMDRLAQQAQAEHPGDPAGAPDLAGFAANEFITVTATAA